MRVNNERSNGLLPGALLAIVVALVGLAGAVKLARTAADFGPAVGDIITFNPQNYLPRDLHTDVVAQRVRQSDCTLNLEAIHRDGGSLIIEERHAGDGSRYRVHWAGVRSTAGDDNCGAQADLLLDDTNLDMLAMAAGGWGAGPKHLAPNTLWAGNANSRVQ